MDVVLILVGVALVMMALSAGLALALRLVASGWSEVRRAIVAASVAAGLPMSIAFGGFLHGSDGMSGGDFVLGFLALVLLAMLLALVFCLPSAWLVTRKLGGKDAVAALESVDAVEDTELLPSGN